MQANKLFVANISFESTEEEIRALFEETGEILDLYYPRDRETGRVRGFAFVTMASDELAQAAIEKLHGRILHDRDLRISVALPRENRDGDGGSRGGPRAPRLHSGEGSRGGGFRGRGAPRGPGGGGFRDGGGRGGFRDGGGSRGGRGGFGDSRGGGGFRDGGGSRGGRGGGSQRGGGRDSDGGGRRSFRGDERRGGDRRSSPRDSDRDWNSKED